MARDVNHFLRTAALQFRIPFPLGFAASCHRITGIDRARRYTGRVAVVNFRQNRRDLLRSPLCHPPCRCKLFSIRARVAISVTMRWPCSSGRDCTPRLSTLIPMPSCEAGTIAASPWSKSTAANAFGGAWTSDYCAASWRDTGRTRLAGAPQAPLEGARRSRPPSCYNAQARGRMPRTFRGTTQRATGAA